MKKIYFPPLLALFLSLHLNAHEIIQKGNVFYLSNTVVVKLKPNYAINSITSNKYISKISINESAKLFPSNRILNKGEEPLNSIYILKYSTSEDPVKAAKVISKLQGVEWAEPKYVRTITYSPNDSLYIRNRQRNLERIDAKDAWQISIGDSTVHIAIVDIGVDWHHPDLKDNILKNPSGQLIGWDFGGLNGIPDNDPSEDSIFYHGTHVAGIAAAVTNNKIGIASIGNKCKIIPIKASRYDHHNASGVPFIEFGFEGIKLAADLGAKVINCSWGGNSYSSLEQEIIDYAVSKGSLIVAAQGNDGNSIPFYPADYHGVLSVGWLHTKDDQKAPKGNYGTNVKSITHPGIQSYQPGQQKQDFHLMDITVNLSGSSMSSPLVAGLAGLVCSKFPKFSPSQVAEQIRVTADNIDIFNPDSLKYLLGRGRINAFKALTDTNAVSVRAENVDFIDEGNGNGLLESGETVSIEINFVNYLKSIQTASVDISSNDPAVSFINYNAHFDTGSMGTNGSVSNKSNKFRFKIASNAPYDYDVHFLLKFVGPGYPNDFQWITAHINPTFGVHSVGDINVTVTSKGVLGFSDFPINSEGTGFSFRNSENLMYEGALMYGTASNKVMNDARDLVGQSNDFVTLIPMKVNNIGSDQIGSTVFVDGGAGTNSLGIKTHFTSYTYSKQPNNSFIILNTVFNNLNTANISGLYAGYFIDWDIPSSDYNHDTTYYNTKDNFAVAFNNNKNDPTVYQKVFTGAALISENPNSYIYYAINNNATSDSVVLSDDNGFSTGEKWFTLSKGNKLKSTSGDISLVVSGGPFNINAKDSINVAFVIAAATTFDSLRAAILQSKTKYLSLTAADKNQNKVPDSFALFQNYPNPFNPTTAISFQLPASSNVQIKIYDILGREVNTLIDEQKAAGKYNVIWNGTDHYGNKVSSGVYMYRIQSIPLSSKAGVFTAVKKMVLIK